MILIKEFFKKIWREYKMTMLTVGRFNVKLILTLVYFLVLPLFKVILFFLEFKRRIRHNSTWEDKELIYKNFHEHQF